jgi:hypothetical protein
MHRRFLPPVSALVSIPTVLADRLEDTKVADETAMQLILVYVHPHSNACILRVVGCEVSGSLSSR